MTTLLKEKQILPIYKSSAISLIEIAYFMGITPEILAQIIAQDIQTVEKNIISKNVIKRIQPLIYALQMLFELTNYDQNEVQRWLAQPQIEWENLSPLDCLQQGNFDAVINLISRIYYGDSAGY